MQTRQNVPVVTDYDDLLIESGRLLEAPAIFAGAVTARMLLIQVPAGVNARMRVVGGAAVAGQVDVYEGTTFSAAGTGVTMQNRNRNIAAASSVVVTHTPTVTLDGTLIFTDRSDMAGVASRRKFVLKPDTDYLVRITPSASAVVAMGVQIYEEPVA